ncbi:hypothetical protein [Alteromonas sp. H39]|uniref:hypothetical protein n=1 Tax=Alteromonas sp. H39 TaxID=3389876 RepID=UPI0039DF8A73
MKNWLVPLTIITLAGCGGSSGGDSNTPPPPTDNTELVLTGETTVIAGDSVDFTIRSSDGSVLSDINWSIETQDVALLAAHTQAVGFDAPAAGDYPMSVTASFANGSQQTLDFVLNVQEGETPLAITRLGHEASEGNRVSLRVDANHPDSTAGSPITVTDISWQQVSGPNAINVRFDDGDDPRYDIYFQAPPVTADQVIEFQATVTYDNGDNGNDTVQVLVKNIQADQDSYFVDETDGRLQTVTDHMLPYRADSPYANALEQCVYSNTITSTCTFGTLPLIGQETEDPSIDDILDRTYVSHPWMGDAFKAFLETSAASEDIRNLLRATTAVVISYEVRPSFYWVATGAIYLDANNFWRTPAERDTLNTIPDYRSNFGDSLNFRTYWRYVRDGEYFYPQPGFSAQLRRSRNNQDIEASLAWLMYHELAHANDFFNYQVWSTLSAANDPLSYYNRNSTQSDSLDNALPLTSQELHDLAEVRYGGEDATATQRGYSAQQVANWFEPDGAVSFYSYFTRREDFANLVERFMMLYRLGVASDVGVFTRETIENNEAIITWGQRNRINTPELQQRVDFAVSRVLPELDVPQILTALPQPQQLPEGASWRDTLTLNEAGEVVESKSSKWAESQGMFAEEHTVMPALPAGR